MTFNWKEMLSSKTFWIAVASIGSAVSAALTGAITWPQAAQAILTALTGMFLKDALVSQTKEIKG